MRRFFQENHKQFCLITGIHLISLTAILWNSRPAYGLIINLRPIYDSNCGQFIGKVTLIIC
ncbi:TPA: hypothetical protein QCR41_005602 [Bacillus cereus]|nr:hypothetical protein [Bacillus cereus]